MERGAGLAFNEATGGHIQEFAGGSNGLADQIKGQLRYGDVLISVIPKVNTDLMGAANSDWVTWRVSFAESPLLLGCDPTSRFAADFKTKPWRQALSEPEIRIGRTDPKLDPKGALTLELMKQAR
jgi:molybdate/tungstate transport system substrate-binding protein